MKVLVIPDVHLKPWMFDRASEILNSGAAKKAVCLMDIPDDWGQEYNLGLYEKTFDAAIWFQKEFPETLWCYGNHDLSYEWLQYESGFSSVAIPVVQKKLSELRRELPDRSQMAYIHRIYDVLFLHGGLTHAFVKYYANDVDYDDTDAVIGYRHALQKQCDQKNMQEPRNGGSQSDSFQFSVTCKSPDALIQTQPPEYNNAKHCIERRKFDPRIIIHFRNHGESEIKAQQQCCKKRKGHSNQIIQNQYDHDKLRMFETSSFGHLSFI